MHTVIVTGADWSGIYGLTKLVPLTDKKLIYSFHFYNPFLFTHQAATWSTPSLGDLGNVPFHYNASNKTDGTVAKVKSTIDEAINFGKK